MPFDLNTALNYVVDVLAEELITVFAGVLIAHVFLKYWYKWRYGRWTITVIKDGETKIDQKKVSPGKIKQVLEVPEDLPVFLKGLCSPFHWIQCDLMADGEEIGLLVQDNKNREFIIDLDKDKQKEKKENCYDKIRMRKKTNRKNISDNNLIYP
jgi:hypothetical protein